MKAPKLKPQADRKVQLGDLLRGEKCFTEAAEVWPQGSLAFSWRTCRGAGLWWIDGNQHALINGSRLKGDFLHPLRRVP
jgi:hypothetical protein